MMQSSVSARASSSGSFAVSVVSAGLFPLELGFVSSWPSSLDLDVEAELLSPLCVVGAALVVQSAKSGKCGIFVVRLLRI